MAARRYVETRLTALGHAENAPFSRARDRRLGGGGRLLGGGGRSLSVRQGGRGGRSLDAPQLRSGCFGRRAEIGKLTGGVASSCLAADPYGRRVGDVEILALSIV